MKTKIAFFGLLILVFASWGITPYAVKWISGGTRDDEIAFCETYMVITALFTGLAFLGAFYAMYLQYIEFSKQTKQLTKQVKLMKQEFKAAQKRDRVIMRPRLKILQRQSVGDPSRGEEIIHIKNCGQTILDITVKSSNSNLRFNPHSLSVWHADEVQELHTILIAENSEGDKSESRNKQDCTFAFTTYAELKETAIMKAEAKERDDIFVVGPPEEDNPDDKKDSDDQGQRRGRSCFLRLWRRQH